MTEICNEGRYYNILYLLCIAFDRKYKAKQEKANENF